MRKLAIIGPGKVGTAIGYLAARRGYSVTVAAREFDAARRAARKIGAGASCATLAEAAMAARIVLLTVSDDAIETVRDQLLAADALNEGTTLAHCSGALSGEVLAATRSKGCAVGSAHPLQTFATVDSAIEHLPRSYWFYEGDEPARVDLEALGVALEARPVLLESGHKILYHAAAVIACNYLVALLDAAFEIAARAGIDRSIARRALAPLVQATLNNVMEMDTAGALTGPIARGDVNTVARQIAAVDAVDAELAQLYRTLGARTLELAVSRGLDAQRVDRLRDCLAALD